MPLAGTGATVGMLSPVDPGDPQADREARIFDRCEDCGAGIQRSTAQVDLPGELRAVTVAGTDGRVLLDAPNRASWQATLGNDGWAAVADSPGRLLLTRRAMALLAESGGIELDSSPGCPPWGRNQRWMLQTLLNAITLHPNFATRVLRGELRAANSRGRFQFAADLVARTLEAVASLFGRGGRLVARTRG